MEKDKNKSKLKRVLVGRNEGKEGTRAGTMKSSKNVKFKLERNEDIAGHLLS